VARDFGRWRWTALVVRPGHVMIWFLVMASLSVDGTGLKALVCKYWSSSLLELLVYALRL
jgi:hypothetical protein